MARTRRIVLATVTFGALGFLGFGLSRLKVTPPSVDPSGTSRGTVKEGLLPHDLFGGPFPSAFKNGLYVERPENADAYTTKGVFKLIYDGGEAERVTVKFGRASANSIEVLDGLKEGDRVITSDMSAWDQFDRIRLR